MHKPVNELVRDQQLLTTFEDNVLDNVLKVMAENRVSSLPVLAKPEEGQSLREGPRYPLAFIDVLDIVAYLANVSQRPLTSLRTGEATLLTTDDVKQMHVLAQSIKVAQVREVMDLADCSPMIALNGDVSIRKVITNFSTGAAHYRLPVVDKQGNLQAVLTQSQIVRSLAKDLGDSEKLRNVKVSKIKYTDIKELKKVPKTMPAINAFIQMHQAKLSSIAVEDEKGDIVDNLSATDLKGLLRADLAQLRSPVEAFLNYSRGLAGKTSQGLVSCDTNTSLGDVLKRIDKEGVHRVYVRDAQGKTTGVLSLTDILLHLPKVEDL